MISYLCIDPGKTVGVAWLISTPEKRAELVNSFEFEYNPMLAEAHFEHWLFEADPIERVVIIEDWEYRHNKPTDARLACKPIGVFEYLCAKFDIGLRYQLPGFRSKMPDTKKLLAPLGYWTGLEGHARQATRHGLAHLVHTAKHMPTMEALFPRPH